MHTPRLLFHMEIWLQPKKKEIESMSRGFQNGTVITSEDPLLPTNENTGEKELKSTFSELWKGSKCLQQSEEHSLKKTTESC